MKATFEESTEILLDSQTLTLNPPWQDYGASAVFRQGRMVTVTFQLEKLGAAWKEKGKYALGAAVTESGKTFTLIKAEAAAENEKPTASPATWREIANPNLPLILPPPYRPAAEVVFGQTSINLDGKVNVVSTELFTSISFPAATVSP